mmetsp:Transcript_21972/g.58547  ORF Transcript_21972/g.58547 Transcript_21972/m.58547 type:complete len:287 (-) Transcript_21972:1043-1903(-)
MQELQPRLLEMLHQRGLDSEALADLDHPQRLKLPVLPVLLAERQILPRSGIEQYRVLRDVQDAQVRRHEDLPLGGADHQPQQPHDRRLALPARPHDRHQAPLRHAQVEALDRRCHGARVGEGHAVDADGDGVRAELRARAAAQLGQPLRRALQLRPPPALPVDLLVAAEVSGQIHQEGHLLDGLDGLRDAEQRREYVLEALAHVLDHPAGGQEGSDLQAPLDHLLPAVDDVRCGEKIRQPAREVVIGALHRRHGNAGLGQRFHVLLEPVLDHRAHKIVGDKAVLRG